LEVNLKEWEFKLCPKTSLKPGEREVLDKWSTYEHKVGSAGQFLYSVDAPNFKPEELEEIERLRPLASKYRGDKVKPQIKLSGRMVLIEDNSTVWEGVVNYKDENSYSPADFTRQPTLFVDILTKAIDNLAENTVNEIL